MCLDWFPLGDDVPGGDGVIGDAGEGEGGGIPGCLVRGRLPEDGSYPYGGAIGRKIGGDVLPGGRAHLALGFGGGGLGVGRGSTSIADSLARRRASFSAALRAAS